jgi:CRP/FNR family transcriptional regulator, anaerobic regulatory protein
VQRDAEVASETRLFCQGDRFATVQIVASGCVKLLETSADGKERIVELCIPGELVGIEGWTHGRYPYTAIAAGRARMCQLQWPQTKHGTPPAALLERLLRKTAAQLDCSKRIWMTLPAIDRVAAFLTRFAERTELACEPPLTRREIGSLLGLAEETVVRAISALRQREQLRFERSLVKCASSAA